MVTRRTTGRAAARPVRGQLDSDEETRYAPKAKLRRKATVDSGSEDEYRPPSDEPLDDVDEDGDGDGDTVMNDQTGSASPAKEILSDGSAEASRPNKRARKAGTVKAKTVKPLSVTFATDIEVKTTTKKKQNAKTGKTSSLGKESFLLAMLGDQADLEMAAEYRESWHHEVCGIDSTIIKSLSNSKAVIEESEMLLISRQEDRLVNESEISEYLPSESTNTVQFIKVETKETFDRRMSTYSSYDPASVQSTLKSFTIATGLRNRACSWSKTLSKTQYLAIGGIPLNHEAAPMFRFEQAPGCIQVWRVIMAGTDRSVALDMVLAHDFGITWSLKWQPCTPRPDSLGLLAGVFGDGSIRVLDVSRTAAGLNLEHKLISQAAYTLKIPDTSVTCFDWLTTSRLAAGCANGLVVIWDLKVNINTPIISGQAHHCFINNIVSCSPSFPDHILTTAWDCDVKISDIYDLEGSTISPSRERAASLTAAWSDHLNCGLTNESGLGARMFSIRHGQAVCFAPCPAPVQCIATPRRYFTTTPLYGDPSKKGVTTTHSFAAIAESAGRLTIVNLVRKYLFKKQPQYKRLVYSCDYAAHEPIDQVDSEEVPEPNKGQTISNGPMSRKKTGKGGRKSKVDTHNPKSSSSVLENTQATSSDLKGSSTAHPQSQQQHPTGENEPKKTGKFRFLENFQLSDLPGSKSLRNGEVPVLQIFPTEMNITQVEWNTNPSFEGVLASCVGPFVRVDWVGT